MQKESGQKKPGELIIILGHTAGGKTRFAAELAHRIDAEIISADSRQIYRGMDIGTGKDYSDYVVEGKQVPWHLLDIVDAGYKYNVFEYQKDFLKAYKDITSRDKRVILCGGTGLYIESVIKGYRLIKVPPDPELRDQLKDKSLEELSDILSGYRKLHNKTDTDTRKRAIRAIEIAAYYNNHPDEEPPLPEFNPVILGIRYTREERRERITERLKTRLEEEGMIDEVRSLLKAVSPEDLEFYGLEYKYLTWYSLGRISYDEMFRKLNISIHQFAKRQMTWFRKMEREGMTIHWIEGNQPMQEKLSMAFQIIGY